MKIEHFALNVPDPNAAGRWYVAHLGFKVVRRLVEPPYTHFLADDNGNVMIEIYRLDVPMLDFEETHPLAMHLALVSQDVEADVRRLVAAGGKLDGEVTTLPSGDCMAMVRDPWGVTLQLVSRAEPMI